MKKTVLALVAVLGLGLASCDRDERVLEVVKEVEKPNALLGDWKLVEVGVNNGQANDLPVDHCMAKSVIKFTEDTYNVSLSEDNKGTCRTESRTGKYLYGEKLRLISLVPDEASSAPGTYSAVLNNDKIVLTLDRKDGKGAYTLTFQKVK